MQPLASSCREVDDLIEWLRDEITHTAYGKVGLIFTLHQGQITGIERTTSIHGKFTLRIGEGEGN